ncbi:MAG: hypothetical protein AAFN30_21260, partial [Actinomycetota bacterium]
MPKNQRDGLHAALDGVDHHEGVDLDAAAFHDRYVEELVERISELVWAHPTIQHSHYKNPHGRVYTLSPWSIDE